ncbi:flagellar basal-body rod protein FlgF [Benzoatithermus flavus]|uniref:Flagellar basal-body rod protein FlgF n=1 Tax=Benzoatithermus flavus TaxID=3108223 RepID=A0ABU8Y017_9PROT
MDLTSYLALSRQMVLDRHMTVVATNLANAGTTAYRAEHTRFARVLERAGGSRPVAFVQDAALIRDLDPGPVTQTGNPLDLALVGPGYFAFATPEGTRYGRAGRLELDASGRLVDVDGHALLDASGNPIVLPADARPITVASDGTISGRGGPIARIGIHAFAREEALTRIGSGLYESAESPAPAQGARVVQGALEGSNVQPVLEMTTMLETVRAFESAQRLLDTQHELERQAIEKTVRASG